MKMFKVQAEANALVDCPTCGGYGYYPRHNPVDPEGAPIQQQCPSCRGIGKIELFIDPTLPSKDKDE